LPQTKKTLVLRHRQKVLEHAERELLMRGKSNSAELIALYKKFLKIEEHRLRLKHNAGGGGREICRQRAGLIDLILEHLFDGACKMYSQPKVKSGLALVAIGGYGRGELNPLSDVDIMFLHADAKKGEPEKMTEIIELILYMLWDVGFKVGHSTRSISTAIKQANDDMQSKTALLEARFLVGDEQLFEDFATEFENRCIKGHEAAYIKERVNNQSERHQKFGGTVYMQEPNIKNGCGSLRDYQNLLWVGTFKDRARTMAQLVEKKRLSDSERRKLDAAYDFLLRVRTELHYLNKRPTDVLTLAFQFKVANKFNYPQKDILRRAETFMRDYYSHARNIFQITELVAGRMSLETPAAASGLRRLLPKARSKKVSFDGFHSIDGLIYPDTREIFREDPYRLMRVFQHAQMRGLALSPELKQLIQRRVRLVDRTFQYSRSARETFMAILSRKGQVGRILRLMHETDFLGRYIPEFGELTCLVQHEFFHRYTADEHTLVCIEKLDELIDTEQHRLADYKALFQRLEDPAVLYLALLLHDTGKSANVRYHSEASAFMAQRVAARLQLSSARRRTLISLVDNHILLSSTAQRRNLEDSATIAEFASVINNQTNLDSLMLLTLVDGQGLGEETWSDWKESLVWQLYRNTSRFLEDGISFFREREIAIKELLAEVTKKMARDFSDEIEAHFHSMPARYFQTTALQDIVNHIRLFRAFMEMREESTELALAPAIRWVQRPERGHTELLVVSWDRKHLLAKIAGAISLSNLNILSADIYTRSDNLVLDIFRVCDIKHQAVTDEKDFNAVEKNLRLSLVEEEYDFTPLLEKQLRKRNSRLVQEHDFPTRINIDNRAHPIYTLVDIQTPDRLGLLYNLMRALGALEMDIALSRITTEKGAAIDTFYITDRGQKIRSEEGMNSIKRALLTATGQTAGSPGIPVAT